MNTHTDKQFSQPYNKDLFRLSADSQLSTGDELILDILVSSKLCSSMFKGMMGYDNFGAGICFFGETVRAYLSG